MFKTELKILLAEDDPNLGLLLVDCLESEGFEVKLCRDGASAAAAFASQDFDLCLLDVMMPKMDGFLLAETIRKKNETIPLIFITARSQKPDKMKAYDIGADDYVTKPFDEEELVWKIKALVRRSPRKKQNTEIAVVSLGRYFFDANNQSLSLDGKLKRITERESEILRYLYDRRNHLVKREDMLRELWGENNYFLGRSLDVFMTKIRKYLKEDSTIRIENVYKVGFIFHVPANLHA